MNKNDNEELLAIFDFEVKKRIDEMESNLLDVLLIIGGAGVGKTTLLKFIIAYLKSKQYKFHLLGATGVAARITSNKTGEFASTIHQKIYGYNVQLSTEGESVFDVIDNSSDENKIIIVDEASMIGNKSHNESSLIYGTGQLLTDLIQSFKISSNSKSKLILVGDQNQLAPVFEEFSPALSKSYLEEIFKLRVHEKKLKENFRQSESPEILNFANQFLR